MLNRLVYKCNNNHDDDNNDDDDDDDNDNNDNNNNRKNENFKAQIQSKLALSAIQ